jgi:hypothetical protein
MNTQELTGNLAKPEAVIGDELLPKQLTYNFHSFKNWTLG